MKHMQYLAAVVLISVFGAGCVQQKNPTVAPSVQKTVSSSIPVIYDPQKSQDGVSVTNTATSITVTSGQETHTFQAPSQCRQDIDQYATLGKNNTIVFYSYCATKNQSAIFWLDAKTGEVVKQKTFPDGVGVAINGMKDMAAFSISANRDDGLVLFNLETGSLTVVMEQGIPNDGNGDSFTVTVAHFSPDGTKLYYIYSQRDPAVPSNDGLRIPYSTHHAIYDATLGKTADASTFFTPTKSLGFYGWIDNSSFATKDGEIYQAYHLN